MKKEEKLQIINLALQEYLETPEKERSLTKIGKKYKVKRQTLSKYLKERGYDVINYQNRLRIDETVFDVIDSEEKAYWLGFLYADGNIGSNEYKLEMNLSAKDSDHMKKFQNFLKYTEDKVRVSKSYSNFEGSTDVCRFSIRNKHIWSALNDKGCVPKKSLILTFPDLQIFTDKSLVRHFLRGYVDGDGTLYTTKDVDGCINTCIGAVGTKEFLQGFVDYLCEYTMVCKNNDSKAYSIKYGYAKARKVARMLYEGATIYLDRKYNKFLEFCHIEEESSNRKSSKLGEDWNVNTELTSEIAKGSEVV